VTDQAGDIVLMNTPAERLFNAPGYDDEMALGGYGPTAHLSLVLV